jgi:flagellar secretion chaperone FliS
MTFARQNTLSQHGAAAYHKEAVRAVEFATPHERVALLLSGALERIAQARGAMEHGMTARKGERIGRAIAIVDSLRSALDADVGGDLARNLAALYEYMTARLLHANLKNDLAALDEVSRLLREIKAGWDGIADSPEAAAAQP